MSFVDSHCHLTDSRFDQDLKFIIERSYEKGIHFFFQGGIEPNEWDKQLCLKQEISGLIPCFGLHPYWIAFQNLARCKQAFEYLKKRIDHTRAIGEIGLDYRFCQTEEQKERQIQFFILQVELAIEKKLPLVLHVVNTHNEVLNILSSFASLKGICHAFNGSFELAQRYLKHGILLSIGTSVQNVKNKKIRKTLQLLGETDFVLETDSPDQPALIRQGEINFPFYLDEIVKEVAKLRCVDEGRLKKQIFVNLENSLQHSFLG